MKYYFWILGCAMNYSDAERISALFDSFGFEKTEDEKEADIFCVIACSVRQHAVDRIYGKVKELKERELTTILSGCVLEADRKKLAREFDLIFEVKDIDKLSQFINNKLQITNHKSEKNPFGICENDYLNIQPNYSSHFRAYVPISTGCNNFCTYCAVPYTKGREKSRPAEEIVAEVRNLVGKGFKEITLLGQNVNSYGNDLNYSSRISEKSTGSRQASNNNFINLIKEIDKIPGKYRVYFYSNHPKDMSDNLITALSTLKHFPHYVHLPLQSGNDEIVKAMNRHYSKVSYLEIVEKIRKAMPDVALTTDIIVGFPGETREQYEDTLDVLKKSDFDMIFSAQFSPRPGTKAAKMTDNVSKEEKKRREKELNSVFAGMLEKKNQKLVGTEQEVLIDEFKNDKMYGRTLGYKVVELKKSPTVQIGDFITVKVESVTSWKISGRVIPSA